MSESALISRSGWFWDFIAGRKPARGDGAFAPTLELKVSFLRPAAPGRLVCTGRVVHRGGSIAFLAGELRNESGDLLATATATARIIRPTK